MTATATHEPNAIDATLSHKTTAVKPSASPIDVAPPFDVTAAIHATAPILVAPPFPGLVAAVANWQMIQQTRIKVELPAKALDRAGIDPPPWLIETRMVLDHHEAEATKRIQAEWKAHPLAAWAKSVPGLGDHSVAVIVGLLNGAPHVAFPKWREGGKGDSRWIIGEPYERSVSQLWSYCGLGAPSKRRKGMSQDEALSMGSPILKARCFVLASSTIKLDGAPDKNGRSRARSPYRDVYDAARAVYADRVHESACAPCHAKAGDPWKPAHQHAAALRKVSKEFLRDLWVAARAGQNVGDTQNDLARAGHGSIEIHFGSARAGQCRLDAHDGRARAGAV